MGLTGTLLSNSALDAYWIMAGSSADLVSASRISIGRGSRSSRTGSASTQYWRSQPARRTKRPVRDQEDYPSQGWAYFKNAPDWWRFAAPKVLRRNYKDPLYLKSLAESGNANARLWSPQIVRVPMLPAQAKLMLSALKDFKDIYQKAVQKPKPRIRI